VLKKFIPQKPMSSIGEGSLASSNEDNTRSAFTEQPRTPSSTT